MTKRKDFRQSRPMPPPTRYMEGAVCPACETNWLKPVEANNSYSRYCGHYICSFCGTKEALEGFFWWRNALKRGIALNEAGQDYVQTERQKERSNKPVIEIARAFSSDAERDEAIKKVQE